MTQFFFFPLVVGGFAEFFAEFKIEFFPIRTLWISIWSERLSEFSQFISLFFCGHQRFNKITIENLIKMININVVIYSLSKSRKWVHRS